MEFYIVFLFFIIMLFFLINVVIYFYIIENVYKPNKPPSILEFLYSSKSE